MSLSDEDLLAEIEDVLRTMPPLSQLNRPQEHELIWLARAGAAIEEWNNVQARVDWVMAARNCESRRITGNPAARLFRILHQARSSLRLRTVGPVNAAIGHGYVHDYLDVLRRIIETAKNDLLFVDRYMNGDFVSRFMPFVPDGVAVRLLTRSDGKTAKNLNQLVVMAKAFGQQHGLKLEIRTSSDHHERFLFVDRTMGFSSGASFKDAPTTAAVTVIEQTGETLVKLLKEHEFLWINANVEARI